MSDLCTIENLDHPPCGRVATVAVAIPYHLTLGPVGGRPRATMRMCTEHADEIVARFPEMSATPDQA